MINAKYNISLVLFLMLPGIFMTARAQQLHKPAVLKTGDYRHYVDYFNRMEDENIVQAFPNKHAWEWMQENIPLFECPQDNVEEIWYYRWWTLRKSIKETPHGYVMTEFLVERSYADKYNMISCALGHHIYEARWLHDTRYLNDYVHTWYRGNEGGKMEKLRAFSSWTAYALYQRFLVDRDTAFLANMLPDLEEEYREWEADRRIPPPSTGTLPARGNKPSAGQLQSSPGVDSSRLPTNSRLPVNSRLPAGLFWQHDVKDGMEESISGGRREKNARPTINSYMFGNALAISKIAALKGDSELSARYAAKADTLKQLVQERLWNPEHAFFETLKETGRFAQVREAIGFIPWYFNLPDPGYEAAWEQLTDPEGFKAPFGLTTAERRHPDFRSHGCCSCEWDGAVWPFATSQTLTALANLLNRYEQTALTDSVYFEQLERYVESQYYRGKPYIGEYLDEKTGYWLKGDAERSRYYNHSTFNDLIITGLVGLRPRADDVIEVNPLIPEGYWDWFCLDNVLYHGNTLTVIWDKTGKKYGYGQGFHLLVNGKKVASSEKLERLTSRKNG